MSMEGRVSTEGINEGSVDMTDGRHWHRSNPVYASPLSHTQPTPLAIGPPNSATASATDDTKKCLQCMP